MPFSLSLTSKARTRSSRTAALLSPLPSLRCPTQESPKPLLPLENLSKTCRSWVLSCCIERGANEVRTRSEIRFGEADLPSLLTNSLVATRFCSLSKQNKWRSFQQWSRKVTPGSGKSHQGRRITMAQPVSLVMIHLHIPKSGRSSAHSREKAKYFAEKARRESCWNEFGNSWCLQNLLRFKSYWDSAHSAHTII